MLAADDTPKAWRAQPEFFKHFVPGIPHKSEMGVPFRFHLAMTDASFRQFVGARRGRNGPADAR